MSENAWLEPIRTAAASIVADPPPLTEWEAGEDDGEVIDHEVEKLLCELRWPTRTKTFNVPVGAFGATRPPARGMESTHRYFPASWLEPLTAHVARYVQARDADKHPEVPDRLRLRKLPHDAAFDTLRDIIEGAWEDAWDELACSVAVMCPYDAMSMDGLRWNLSLLLFEGPDHGVDWELVGPAEERKRKAESYEQRMARDEADMVHDLRELPSPKWREWFRDTWNDRITIHNTLERCGIAVTGQLCDDLVEAGYALDTNVTGMTIEELVSRVDARHRLLASAFRAAREDVYQNDARGFGPKQPSSRPPAYDAVMEEVGRLRGEGKQWKEIREEVQKTHGHRCESEDALRKRFERWVNGRKSAG